MRNWTLLLAAAGLSACGQSGDQAASNKQAAAAPKKEKPKYCFFKDAESKDWTAKRGKDGNVVVTGKLYRSDGRYMAVLGRAARSTARPPSCGRPSASTTPAHRCPTAGGS